MYDWDELHQTKFTIGDCGARTKSVPLPHQHSSLLPAWGGWTPSPPPWTSTVPYSPPPRILAISALVAHRGAARRCIWLSAGIAGCSWNGSLGAVGYRGLYLAFFTSVVLRASFRSFLHLRQWSSWGKGIAHLEYQHPSPKFWMWGGARGDGQSMLVGALLVMGDVAQPIVTL
jgi:hypothetical protein